MDRFFYLILLANLIRKVLKFESRDIKALVYLLSTLVRARLRIIQVVALSS